MDTYDRKEYQSVVLAALLHDVGKLLHRGHDQNRGSHEDASSDFVKEFSSQIRNDELFDISLIKLMVRHHHSTKKITLEDPYFAEISEKRRRDRIWKLIKIVQRADSYSCAERDVEQQRRREVELRRVPLDSIFSNVNLDIKEPHENENLRYHLQPLHPFSSFPDSIKALPDKEIQELIDKFKRSIPKFSDLKYFDDALNIWMNILEKYTWAVPSDTRYETSDVSLYDHLRSSAAIAACLYKRHIVAIEKGKNFDRLNEFVFIGGDFSGIQDYIFDITNKGSGGASKRLRARSFFISLFSEVTIHKILHALGLPLACNLFSAGGKFLLLSPNVNGIEDTLKQVKSEIEREINDTFFSQFSFLVSWRSIKGFRETFKVYSFFRAADDMFHHLETEKVRKCQSAFLDDSSGKWNVSAFKASKLYETYQRSGDCKICGKGPAIFEDPDTGLKESCKICHRDKFIIGQELPKAGYVAFAKGVFDPENARDKIVIFKPYITSEGETKEGYYVELLRKPKVDDEYYLIYKIGQGQRDIKIEESKPSTGKYYANHVPTDENGAILNFEEIAGLSKWEKEGKVYGSDLLGVLKVDIDNLGLIFSKGFENPRRIERGFNDIDRKTVSRFLTMSRMIELFFSGWMKELMTESNKKIIIEKLSAIHGIDKVYFEKYLGGDQINFGNIYTVYSAGDDMILVGPWETMIVFSIFLNLEFKKYTCYNKYITLSAGLAFVKPKHPIASAIKQADSLLQKSKAAGKKMITLFGTTIVWEKLPVLIDFFLFLDKKMNDNDSEIKTSFLHRLLKYHHMALRYLDEKDIQGLKYLSSLSYDIGRNIAKWDKNKEIIKGREEFLFLQKLINEKPNREALIYNLKVPLFWALYRNRRIA